MVPRQPILVRPLGRRGLAVTSRWKLEASIFGALIGTVVTILTGGYSKGDLSFEWQMVAPPLPLQSLEFGTFTMGGPSNPSLSGSSPIEAIPSALACDLVYSG